MRLAVVALVLAIVTILGAVVYRPEVAHHRVNTFYNPLEK